MIRVMMRTAVVQVMGTMRMGMIIMPVTVVATVMMATML